MSRSVRVRTTPNSSAITSRLQRALASTPIVGAAVASGELLAWLGQPLDLQSASDLAAALSAPTGGVSPVPGAADPGEPCEEILLAARGSLLAELARSFAGAEGALIPLPRFDAPSALDGLSGVERLRRFHAAWQREMELRVQALRRCLRDGLREVSAALAGLAALDEAFERHVLRAGESALTSLPLLMVPRWEALLADEGVAAGRAQVVNELRELLLAELEQRLQPALGLVEACVAHGEMH